MKNLWQKILISSVICVAQPLMAATRIDLLLIQCGQLPHLTPRSLPYEMKEYPQSIQVYESKSHRWEQYQEFQKAPWRIEKTYSWIVPSFTQKSYISLVSREKVPYPIFQKKPDVEFFWAPRPLYFAPYKTYIETKMLGYAEIYSMSPQQRLKISLCLQTPHGTISFQEILPYQQWVIIDNPYLTALIHLEKIP